MVYQILKVLIIITLLFLPSLTFSNSKLSELYLSKGVAEFNEGRFENALIEFTKIEKSDPKYPLAQYYLGLTLIQLNDLKGGLTALKKSLELDPSIPRVHYDLGIAYFKLGDYENALKELKAAQDQEPDRAMIYFYQGYILYLMNRIDESTPYLQRAGELDPSLKQSAKFFAGLNALKAYRLSEAEIEFSDTYKIDPTSELGLAAKDYLNKIVEAKKGLKKWDIIPSYSLQYDDNVIQEPDTGISPLRISDESDFRQVFFIASEYRFIQRENWLISGRYTLYQSLHASLHDYDLQNHQNIILSAYRGKICGKTPYRMQIDYRYTNAIFNEHRYLGSHTGTLTLDIVLFPQWINQFLYHFQEKNFYFHRPTKAADRDADNNLIGFNEYLFFSGGKRYIKIGYAYDKDIARGHNWDYEGHTVSAGFYTPLILEIMMHFDFNYWNQDYDNKDSYFKKRRNDEEYTYSVSFNRALSKIFSINLQYTHITHNSNITIYDFNRNIVGLTFTAKF